MPHALTDFSPIDPAATETFSFNFTPFLGPTEIISSASVTLVAKNGLDLSPSSRLIGPTVISGSYVLQLIGTCVPGEKYFVTATANTTAGQVEPIYAYFQCNAPV